MDVLIKNVREESWKKFRIEAIKRNKKVGDLFTELTNNIEASKGNWNRIKNSKASISDKDAENLKKDIQEFRKNFDFRY